MNGEVYADWGERIRKRREAMQLTQAAFGTLCDNLDQSTVSRLERGLLHPSDELKWKIAGALGTTVDKLFPYPNVRPPVPDVEEAAAS